jgi:alkanesulfonate monooxygenase SsuD/methylene tetrahydromethanopterin reductase-like flavin-dependent oxidoreductase (luciferase family)
MSILHPNPSLPIWLGAGGEATIRLSAELGQGLLPLRFAPGAITTIGPWIEEGFRRAGNGKSWDGFEIQSGVGVTITDDLQSALDARKPQIALYVGGMGARGQNYHNDAMVNAGFPEEAAKIQELYLAGRKEEAIDAVPDAYVERSVLIGSPERIRERYRAWAESGVTGITISTNQLEALELMADIVKETPAIGPEAALKASSTSVSH